MVGIYQHVYVPSVFTNNTQCAVAISERPKWHNIE